MRVGVISPGDMGSAIAGRLIQNQAEVLACLSDRSERTRRLAREAGVQSVANMNDLVSESDVVLSVVVPAKALDVARELASAISTTKSSPLVLDCNAVSPQTAQGASDLISNASGRFVDASIIGPPPRTDVNTALFVSGPNAPESELLSNYGLRVIRVGDRVGSASALKMSYAALTKGLVVLGVQLLLAAEVNGVYDELHQMMNENVPTLATFFAERIPEVPVKAFRFVGEMQEIDTTIIEAGLPGGTFESLARVCEWLAESDLARETPETRDRNRSSDDTIQSLATHLHVESGLRP